MTKQRTVTILASGIVLAALAASFAVARLAPLRPLDPTDTRTTLAHVEDAVAKTFGVDEVVTRDLEDMLDEAATVLFDVRTAAEFDMGHLPGAIRVEPGLPTDVFLRTYSSRIEGRAVIFYCSIGVRSAELAARLEAQSQLTSAIGQFNLRGGAFRWVVEGRALGKGDRPGHIHPYSKDWGRLLARSMAAQ